MYQLVQDFFHPPFSGEKPPTRICNGVEKVPQSMVIQVERGRATRSTTAFVSKLSVFQMSLGRRSGIWELKTWRSGRRENLMT